jgi:hypothetical protein
MLSSAAPSIQLPIVALINKLGSLRVHHDGLMAPHLWRKELIHAPSWFRAAAHRGFAKVKTERLSRFAPR